MMLFSEFPSVDADFEPFSWQAQAGDWASCIICFWVAGCLSRLLTHGLQS
jgi:hypothetical protein